MAVVFDKVSVMTGTDDGGGDQDTNVRIYIPPGQLSSASGTTCQIEGRFGTATGVNATALKNFWFGQSAGGGSPSEMNFTGDQVNVKWSANNFVGSSVAGVVTSDTFTLAQSFDNTKGYVLAYHVDNDSSISVAQLSSDVTNANGINRYQDSPGLGDESSHTTATTANYGVNNNGIFFLEKITITGGGAPAVEAYHAPVFRVQRQPWRW